MKATHNYSNRSFAEILLIFLSCVVSLNACGTLMLNTLALFDGTNGTSGTSLIQTSDGNFYWTSEGGGLFNRGSVFRLASSGDLSVVASFDGTNCSLPFCELVQDEAGVLYGTTRFGGSTVTGSVYSAPGTIFKITTRACY
jgi:hypothetical protein